MELWVKDHFQVHISDERVYVVPGFTILSVHPASAKEVPLLILGVRQAVHDQTIVEYLAKFGINTIKPVSEKIWAKSGMWKGLPNGDRRFKVDTSKKLENMGTFHLIAGRKVRVLYLGNISTCGQCHVAGHKANKCRESGGIIISIEDHMHKLHQELAALRLQADE